MEGANNHTFKVVEGVGMVMEGTDPVFAVHASRVHVFRSVACHNVRVCILGNFGGTGDPCKITFLCARVLSSVTWFRVFVV